MNYDAVRNLSKPRIRELLLQYVPKSEGTCFYLEIMDSLTSSYLDKKVAPIDRVYKINASVYLSIRQPLYYFKCIFMCGDKCSCISDVDK
jgi:hypothetical protein